MGGQTTPALAAFANGSMAHAMDYDDTHAGGAGHRVGPAGRQRLRLHRNTVRARRTRSPHSSPGSTSWQSW
ncbi:MAG: MmgE/PrpD family protein, partial [Burkholderiales bacterium]